MAWLPKGAHNLVDIVLYYWPPVLAFAQLARIWHSLVIRAKARKGLGVAWQTRGGSKRGYALRVGFGVCCGLPTNYTLRQGYRFISGVCGVTNIYRPVL